MSDLIGVHLSCVRACRRFTCTSPMDALVASALGAAGELGEVIEPIKKAAYHGRDLDSTHVLEEIGDVLWYLHSLIDLLGSDLETVLLANATKLARRHAVADPTQETL